MATSSVKLESQQKCFGGTQYIFSHDSAVLGCRMRFGVYVPPRPVRSQTESPPVLMYLSGLTCTEENFVTKAGAQRYAAEQHIALVAPDTSPRNYATECPGDNDSYDFGLGAGFYVDATVEPWSHHYRMYSYIVDELPELLKSDDAFVSKINAAKMSITGHSMGGHGALTIFLKNSTRFCSASAFAPICNPSDCPWGRKALGGYLGDNEEAWKDYDATALVEKYNGTATTILIDQGADDQFLSGQLKPHNLVVAAKGSSVHIQYRNHEGYDHSYYFISTFIGDHIRFHSEKLHETGTPHAL